MIIKNTEFGRVEITNIPLPCVGNVNINGTYTFSGRVLVAVRERQKGEDWYKVFTMEEDGTGVCQLFDGIIRNKKGANGIRWMCYSDNRRILLGDYVLECTPDLDSCTSSELVEVVFPEEIEKIPGLYMRWSEPLIAPDNEHICFSSLTRDGVYNFLGRLVRKNSRYVIEDICIINTVNDMEQDKDNEGFYRANVHRGGEVKQFIRGGRGLTLAGGGTCITESTLQMLDTEEVVQITETLGYEETAIFSPNEKYAVCMSPRFSPETDCGVLGVVPLYNDMITRRKYLRVLYQYAIAGVRYGRTGNIGPALVNVQRSMSEGRSYQGVDLSDPEGKWVYYSPMSWHPDSTKAMWNESTRAVEGTVNSRLRRCRLLDIQPSEPVRSAITPGKDEIPYALPVETAIARKEPEYPLKLKGTGGGVVINSYIEEGTAETYYDNYSEDGKTFYNGWIRVKASENMFQPEETVIWSDIQVMGEHNGQMKLRITFLPDREFQVHLVKGMCDDGYPKSAGFAEYDGIRRDVENMAD
ncbi:hypothetical protein [Eisenbergiella sp.]